MMSAKIILLVCVFVCHQGTIAAQTTPVSFCVYNNVTYAVNSTTKTDTCMAAYCDTNGEVSFDPTCCEYENEIYELNSDFTSCSVYGHCESDGQVSIDFEMADCLFCDFPIYIDGECCPECGDYPEFYPPICYNEGEVLFDVVGPVKSKDPCMTCDCPPEGGDAECRYVDCVRCNEDETEVFRNGQCCPDCLPMSTAAAPGTSVAPYCDYNGQIYEVGPVLPTDPCHTCECPPYGGQVECYYVTCPSCPADEYPIYNYDMCCPECVPITTSSLPTTPQVCDYDGQTYQLNSTTKTDTCMAAYCDINGEVSFGPTCCEYDDNIYDLNSHFNIFPCNYGYCENDGQVTISMPGCPLEVLNCKNLIYVNNQCCTRCDDPPSTPTEPIAPTTSWGPTSSWDPASPSVSTIPDAPDTPRSTENVDPADLCAPTTSPVPAAPVTSAASAPVCDYNGQVYEPGPVPPNYPCETCECPEEGGDVVCYLEPCRSCPGWADAYPEPGQCCPTCENSPRP